MNIFLVFIIQLAALILAWLGLRIPALITYFMLLIAASFIVYGFMTDATGIAL